MLDGSLHLVDWLRRSRVPDMPWPSFRPRHLAAQPAHRCELGEPVSRHHYSVERRGFRTVGHADEYGVRGHFDEWRSAGRIADQSQCSVNQQEGGPIQQPDEPRYAPRLTSENVINDLLEAIQSPNGAVLCGSGARATSTLVGGAGPRSSCSVAPWFRSKLTVAVTR